MDRYFSLYKYLEFLTNFAKMLASTIKNYKEPLYKKDPNELLRRTGNNIKKPSAVDIDNVLDNAKLNSSFTPKANIEFWRTLLAEYEIPQWGDVRKEKPFERYFKALCIGVFHYEYLVDTPDVTMMDYYAQAVDYAVDLLCPQKQVRMLMNKTVPIDGIAKTFNVPEEIAKRAIYKILISS